MTLKPSLYSLFSLKKGLLAAAVVLWVGASFWLIAEAGGRAERPFDPDGRLYHNANLGGFDDALQRAASEIVSNVGEGGAVLHIEDPRCPCQVVLARHRKVVSDIAVSKKMTQHAVSYQALSAKLKSIIPSTPAVIVLDAEGRPAYLGPYGEGVSCTAGDSMVEGYMGIAPPRNQGTAIPFEAKGCYCNKA